VRKRTAKGRRVGILMGGLSAEREVSLKTGSAVHEALRRRGYKGITLDVGRDIARDLRRRRIEIAFIALHGRGGEDGTIQGLLQSMGIPFTGSGVLSSALAMDKKHTKWVFRAHRLPTAPFLILREGVSSCRRWPFPHLRPPVVVKPTCEGSTIGVRLVKRVGDLAPALKSAFRYGSEVMLERYLPGRELTVGVLGGKALPVVEVLAPGGFYDYRAKYRRSSTRYLVPAPLDNRTSRRLQKMAASAHGALDCSGATRVDFRLSREGRPFLLEVNTIPGMTATSLLPKAAGEAGMSFEELVEWILLDALAPKKERKFTE
jgi:D-alanine-D-alanine ligase